MAKESRPLTFAEIEALRSKLLQNTADLIAEAELLLANAHHARATTLSIIAVEESSKIPRLLEYGDALLAGATPDWVALHEFLGSHSEKLKANLLKFKEIQSPSKVPAVGTEGWKEVLARVKTMNRLKQDGLYGFSNESGAFRPEDQADPEKASDAINLAKVSYNTSDLLGRAADAKRAGNTQMDLRLRYPM